MAASPVACVAAAAVLLVLLLDAPLGSCKTKTKYRVGNFTHYTRTETEKGWARSIGWHSVDTSDTLLWVILSLLLLLLIVLCCCFIPLLLCYLGRLALIRMNDAQVKVLLVQKEDR